MVQWETKPAIMLIHYWITGQKGIRDADIIIASKGVRQALRPGSKSSIRITIKIDGFPFSYTEHLGN